MQKSKMSEEALQIAVKRREGESKGEKVTLILIAGKNSISEYPMLYLFFLWLISAEIFDNIFFPIKCCHSPGLFAHT